MGHGPLPPYLTPMILFSHDAALRHVTPPGHPERVARIEAVAEALSDMTLDRRSCPPAEDGTLLRGHPQEYIDAITRAEPHEGLQQLDPDTWMSPGSVEAARRAVGGACAAVDAVMDARSEHPRAFVAMRPPGHHAEASRSMGFCLFSTVALAALHAAEAHGLTRIAVVDFDVHHGNGTQDVLWSEERVRFATSQQMPLWPGTGDPSERGAHGQVMNVPLAPGTGGAEMRRAYEQRVLPWLDAYAPELVLVSAGFDAHADDPLANLEWSDADFAWVTARLVELAEAHAGGRVVSCLEGGYDLGALGRSVRAHADALAEGL